MEIVGVPDNELSRALEFPLVEQKEDTEAPPPLEAAAAAADAESGENPGSTEPPEPTEVPAGGFQVETVST